MSPDAYIPVHVTADTYGRITVPKHLSDCIPWLRGTENPQAWIFLIAASRYRLLSDEEVQSDPQLEAVRSLVLEGKSAAVTEPTFAEESRRAAIVATLVQATIAPFKPGWRISFPKGFNVFRPPECDPNAFSILLSLEGYLEVWYTDVLRKAALPLEGQQ